MISEAVLAAAAAHGSFVCLYAIGDPNFGTFCRPNLVDQHAVVFSQVNFGESLSFV